MDAVHIARESQFLQRGLSCSCQLSGINEAQCGKVLAGNTKYKTSNLYSLNELIFKILLLIIILVEASSNPAKMRAMLTMCLKQMEQ